ncbi:formylglycine-generating enzyme family protein [Nocardia mexicana]|uniref:Formylglycine-generating enzyme required for sulfatase activity n=1 Tax=Nocardia mexicana TaxID=279262 RepID=A0A370H673_9NOCA|nr:SUMF1/EgtB/PvdO family nonheme iron enzyme [Nocardia mexicana]RDI49661.1 formylglycine-generating enzyme required for sulfatase activity [Nocardia mexicana]
MIETAALPAGRVTLSDRRTQRSWTVEIAPCDMSVYPITQAQYADLTGEWPSAARGDRLPVESVSWWDAIEFCNALSRRAGLAPVYRREETRAGAHDEHAADGRADIVHWDRTGDGYRLPTEAEWEFACRAGTSGPRYGPLDDIAWYRGNSGGRSHEVGGKRANAFGLHDMLGNVWNWCWDTYDPEVYGSYRVLRGGGWFDEHWSCRAGVRRRSHPAARIEDIGFRVARGGALSGPG